MWHCPFIVFNKCSLFFKFGLLIVIWYGEFLLLFFILDILYVSCTLTGISSFLFGKFSLVISLNIFSVFWRLQCLYSWFKVFIIQVFALFGSLKLSQGFIGCSEGYFPVYERLLIFVYFVYKMCILYTKFCVFCWKCFSVESLEIYYCIKLYHLQIMMHWLFPFLSVSSWSFSVVLLL